MTDRTLVLPGPGAQEARLIPDRIRALDWSSLTHDLDERGCAVLPAMLTRDECRVVAAMFERDDLFRSTVVMARHGFGRGKYKNMEYPLPPLVSDLRAGL